jgi:hypothetical protein
MFKDSFKGSTGKTDHKRLTVFAFTLLVFIIGGVALYKKEPIPNQAIVEYVLVAATSVILGGMGLSKIDFRKTKKEEPEHADQ